MPTSCGDTYLARASGGPCRRASKRSRNMNIRRVAIGRPAASALRAKAEAKRRREGLRYARVRLQPDTTDAQVALNAALPMRFGPAEAGHYRRAVADARRLVGAPVGAVAAATKFPSVR